MNTIDTAFDNFKFNYFHKLCIIPQILINELIGSSDLISPYTIFSKVRVGQPAIPGNDILRGPILGKCSDMQNS